MSEHELGRTRFRILERSALQHALVDRDADVLEHVERRVKRTVLPMRMVSHVAVPAAVVELGAEDCFCERREAWIVVEEVRSEPEPECEVTQVDALEEVGAVDLLAGWDEAVEEADQSRSRRRVPFRDAERDEEQESPRGRRPASGGPLSVSAPAREQLGSPPFLERALPLPLPRLPRLVEQVAHDLPANRGVALEQPVDDAGVLRHRRANRPCEEPSDSGAAVRSGRR
jgi:hypothetical protein